MAIQDFTAGQVLTAAQMDSLQANDYNWTVSTKTASYTLVAADKGTRVVMNSASATTITVNTSIFAAGDVLWIQNINNGTCTITAGTCTVNTAGSLALSQWQGGSLYFTSASTAIFFLAGGSSYGTATGGIGAPTSVTISSVNYQYLTFTSTGTLTVTRAGFFDYCAVAGGSGATYRSTKACGGGGAGQIVIGSIYLSSNQTVTIGAGSSFIDALSLPNLKTIQAGNTTIGAAAPFAVAALGAQQSMNQDALAGYVGGGNGAQDGAPFPAITESAALGYRGGDSSAATNGGGGGGSTARGGNGSTTTGGTGGAGFDVSAFIGGSELRKSMGGGGGGSVTGGTAATGGVAGSATTTPPNGNANSGGGAGGGYGVLSTGNGGSGICYIRWKV